MTTHRLGRSTVIRSPFGRGRSRLRITAAVAGTLVAAALPASASAATWAGGVGTQTVTTASWRLVASATQSAAIPAVDFLNVFGLLAGPVYFSVTNIGTATLDPSRYLVTYPITSAGLGLGAFEIWACDGTWNETLNTCTGVQTLLNSTAVSQTPTTSVPVIPSTPGSSVRLQLRPNGISVITAAQVDVSVTKR